MATPILNKFNGVAKLAFLLAIPAALQAQWDFTIDGCAVQIHSFAQQGFAYSNQNNFLTMNTSHGSFAMTDGGANISATLTDKFRVGAQVYDRNIGQLGGGHPQLDWAYGDYKFTEWFGIRAGKVKTTLGLYNDTQDAEFLYTWALLPQAVYPTDLRSNFIAHTGFDAYGAIGLRKLGSLNYTGYFGTRPNDKLGGYYFAAADFGVDIKSYSGKAGGGDLRWTTPVPGLLLGGSWEYLTVKATGIAVAYGNAPVTAVAQPQEVTSIYGDYARGRWHFTSEFRKNRYLVNEGILGTSTVINVSDRAMFFAAAYRVSKRLELGTYNSRYYVDQPIDNRPAANHIFDQTVTARFDITKWWNIKLEGHFMNGFGEVESSHGFYPRDNPNLKPTTNMFVIRTGYNL